MAWVANQKSVSDAYLNGGVDERAIYGHDAFAEKYLDDVGQTAPIFDGSWDWHSSVHAHLARVISFETQGDQAGLAEFVAERFPDALVQAEIEANIQDPYGWAWLLQLDNRLQDNGFNEMAPAADAFAERLVSYVEDRIEASTAGRALGSHGDINWMLGSLAQWAENKGDHTLVQQTRELFNLAQEQSTITEATSIAEGDFYSQVAISAYAHLAVGATDTDGYAVAFETMLSAVTDGSLDNLISETSDQLDAGVNFGHYAGLVLSTGFGYWALFEETLEPAFYAAYDRVVQFAESVADQLGDGIGPGHWLPNFAAFASGLPSDMLVPDPDGTIAASISLWIEENGYHTHLSLVGTNDADLLEGGFGDDTLDGSRGEDTLLGGDGDDLLLAGYDWGEGDVFDGGAGNDTYQVFGTEVDHFAFNIDLQVGTDQYSNSYSGIENLVGGQASDQLIGDRNDNLLVGMSGNDTLDGSRGADTLLGGEGDDLLLAGYDRGNGDVFDGGAGNDTYQVFGTEVDHFAFNIDLQVGTDQYNNSYSGIENLTGGLEDDRFIGTYDDNLLVGMSGNDTLDGSRGADTLLGGEGDDLLLAGYDRGNGDVFDGGAGNDTYQIFGTEVDHFAFHIDLQMGSDQYSNSYSGIENLVGGKKDDILTGDGEGNYLAGMAGDDDLFGNDGDDTLVGGQGDDWYIGGEGVDSVVLGGLLADFTATVHETFIELMGEGTDKIDRSVETLQFDDGIMSLNEFESLWDPLF